jgi:hypothetical protein
MTAVALHLTVAAGLAAIGLQAAMASCAPEEFGRDKAGLCDRRDCLPSHAPAEIRRLQRGIVSEYTGMFVNDGIGRWVAIDLASSQLSIVDVFAGKHFGAAAEKLAAMKPHDAGYGRRRGLGPSEVIEFVTVQPVPPAAMRDLVCDANALWTSKQETPPAIRISDSANRLYLVDRGDVKAFGGPGDLDGEALRLRDRLNEMAGARR